MQQVLPDGCPAKQVNFRGDLSLDGRENAEVESFAEYGKLI